MNVRTLKDSVGAVFSPKVSADSVYMSGSTTNLTSKLSTMDSTIGGKADSSSLAPVATSGSYNDLSNKPSIPTKTSQLTNDSGFTTGTIPTKTSQLENDSGFVTGDYLPISGGDVSGVTNFTNTTPSSDTTTGAVTISGGLGVAGDIYAEAVYNAVWNDLADCIPVDNECKVEPGYCYCFDGKKYYKSAKYLDEGIIGIDSDTYGVNMGRKLDLNQMDVAVAGFVLAYVDKEYPAGTPLTCTENGYLTKIKKEDKIEYPERIVAIYWKNEPAEEWGTEDRKVKVNGRKWVKIK